MQDEEEDDEEAEEEDEGRKQVHADFQVPVSLRRLGLPAFNEDEVPPEARLLPPAPARALLDIRTGQAAKMVPLETAYRLIPTSIITAPVRIKANFVANLKGIPEFAWVQHKTTERSHEIMALDGH